MNWLFRLLRIRCCWANESICEGKKKLRIVYGYGMVVQWWMCEKHHRQIQQYITNTEKYNYEHIRSQDTQNTTATNGEQ